MKNAVIVIFGCFCLFLSGCINSSSDKGTALNQTDSLTESSSGTVKSADSIIPEQKPYEININFLNNSGDLGQVTFTKNERTIFYFDRKEGSGQIKINDTVFILTRENQKSAGYEFYSNKIEIKTSKPKYEEMEGGDCAYATVSNVEVKLNGKSISLKDISVQDCPSY